MKKKPILAILLILNAFFLTSCATLLAPKTHPLSLNSKPEDAEIYIDGVKMGKTPVKIKLKASKSYIIEFRKEGYEPISRIVNTKVNTDWLLIDVLAGFLPVLVDAATGAWNVLDQKSVEVTLPEYKKNNVQK